MARDDLVIIGAGPAGLGLSLFYPDPSRILEQSSEVGGLCRSVEFAGAIFDIGGHSFHSPYPEVTAVVEDLMRGNWYTQRREARVLFGGDLVDYPFQQHLDQIRDAAIAAECRRGLPQRDPEITATNFEDWIIQRFGPGVARHFMLPYNRKLWARDLRRMSCEWVVERIAQSDPAKAHDGPGRAPLARDNLVSYPKSGGFGEIYRTMARKCGPIAFNQNVVRIDPLSRTVTTARGASWGWQRLASTMPLPALLRAIDGCPNTLIADADKLEFVSLKILMLVVGAKLKAQPQRIYIADPGVPAHKIAFNHTSSPSLRNRPRHGIICEIAYSPEKPPAPNAALEARMIAFLVEARLIDSPKDIVESRIVDVPYGYPAYTPDRPAIVQKIESFLDGRAIHTLGRFGRWEYANSDGCIWQALNLARRLRSAPQRQ
jgi:UDP-galactopyranose mutase